VMGIDGQGISRGTEKNLSSSFEPVGRPGTTRAGPVAHILAQIGFKVVAFCEIYNKKGRPSGAAQKNPTWTSNYGTIVIVATAGPAGFASTDPSCVITRPKSGNTVSALISASFRPPVFTISPSF
jgi:hypothetical protein